MIVKKDTLIVLNIVQDTLQNIKTAVSWIKGIFFQTKMDLSSTFFHGLNQNKKVLSCKTEKLRIKKEYSENEKKCRFNLTFILFFPTFLVGKLII